jgi:hypothetical protein
MTGAKAETISLQRDLIRLGYLRPLRSDGRPSDDGIYGPKTKAAYEMYWREHGTKTIKIQVPVVTPEAATPWWTSRGIWGSLISLVAVVAGIAGHGFDAQEATDAIMPIVDLVPLVLGAIGGLLAWWGRITAKAPIDPTLVANIGGHDLRLPSRMHDKPLPSGSKPERRDPRGLFGD